MRNTNIVKVANIISIFVVFALLLSPFLVGAQGDFKIPKSDADPLSGEETASDIITRIISILLAIAGLVAVIFLIVGGFRYITAGGNEESSESAKKTIQNAIIGIVIIILAFVIVRVVANALISGKSKI